MGEQFSKAPLYQVICEVKFPANIFAACRKDEFYSDIKASYPEVVFPKPSFQEHPLAQAAQYVSGDKNKVITCSAESLSFCTYRYESYRSFRKECIRLMSLFSEKYPTIDKITRIGLRYVNHVLLEQKERPLILSECINLGLSLPDSFSKYNVDTFQSSFFVVLEPHMSGVTVIVDKFRNDRGKNYLLLDFDLVSLRETNFKEVDEHLDDYHKKIEEMFINIITDGYKKSIR